MKKIIVFLFVFSTFLSQAQQLELKYSRLIYPFKWSITQIESKRNETLVSVKVKNKSFEKRFINFADGEFVFSAKYPEGMRASKNTLQFSSSLKNLSLRYNEEMSFVLTFPTPELGLEKEFSLKIGTYFTLNGIIIPELSLAEVNRQMQTWEEYYNINKKSILTYRNREDVKKAIQQDVESWQKKGEFETTSAWKARVNDKTRQKYISEITSKIYVQYKNELNTVKQEQIELAKKYTDYKEALLKQYYSHKMARATNILMNSNFELRPYDADHETFLIHNNSYGDVLLPVPVEEAPSFKQNWYNISRNIKPEFVPNGEDVALNKLIFTNSGRQYIYDSHTIANYAITDVNYNFAPIEIAEINFEDIEKEGVFTTNTPFSSSIVGLKNQDTVLASTNITPERKQIFASDKSDVDIQIPHNSELKNSTTFAVIIANEKYNNVSPVPYAENDGEIFSKYLTNTIGLPKEHVKKYNNATFGNIAGALKHINNLSLAFGDKLNLIFYYAGHGVPNEQTKQCMILPVDGDALIPETCYDVNRLYNTLGELNANSVIVMMDACFSGSLRGDGMLFASRSVKIKSNYSEPKGKMVIFSASQGDETAFPFEKEQHGMFTYYLLKCLQEKNGNVTLGYLSEYLIDQVKRQSVVSNGKLQTPIIQYTPEIEDIWRSWTLAQ